MFWITLVPFTTAWMSETYFASVPVALYGVVLLMAALAVVAAIWFVPDRRFEKVVTR